MPESNINPEYNYDVFISYAHANEENVKPLVNRLKEEGFRVWIDDDKFNVGAIIDEELEKGIKESAHILMCLSPEYLESEWATFEGQLALVLNPASRNRRLMPIVIKNVEIPLKFKRIYCPDFTGDNWEKEYKRLVRSIKRKSSIEVSLKDKIVGLIKRLSDEYRISSRAVVDVLSSINERIDGGKPLQREFVSECISIGSNKIEEMIRQVVVSEKLQISHATFQIEELLDLLSRENPNLLKEEIKRAFKDIHAIRDRVVLFNEESDENLPYLLNNYAESFVITVSWLYEKYGKRWEEDYIEHTKRITPRIAQGSQEPLHEISSRIQLLRKNYQDALELFQERQLQAARQYCHDIIASDPHTREQVEPLIVRIDFYDLFTQFKQYSENGRIDQCIELQERIETIFLNNPTIQVCLDTDLKQFEEICQQVNLLREFRRGIEQLQHDDLDVAQDTFKFIVEMTTPKNEFRQKAQRLKDISHHLMNLKDHDAIVKKVETLQKNEWPFDEDWKGLHTRLLNVEDAYTSLKDALKDCDDLFEYGLKPTELLSQIDKARIDKAIKICRDNNWLQKQYDFFLEKLRNDNLEAAKEALKPLSEITQSQSWVEYLNSVDSLRQGWQQISEKLKQERETELDESYWQGLVDDMEKLYRICLPIMPFYQEHIKPRQDEIGQSIFVDCEKIVNQYEYIRQRDVLAKHLTHGIELSENGEFAQALDNVREAEQIDPSFGNVKKLITDLKQAQKYQIELNEIEEQITKRPKPELLKRLKSIGPDSTSLAFNWLMRRKKQIVTTLFADENERRRGWLEVFQTLRKKPYIQGAVLGQEVVEPKGFRQLLCFRLNNNSFLDKIIDRLVATIDDQEFRELRIEDLIDFGSHTAPSLLVALGEFEQAKQIASDHLKDGIDFIELYNKGILYYLEHFNVSGKSAVMERNGVSSLKQAQTYLLPLFLTDRGKSELSKIQDIQEIDSLIPEVVDHLESLLVSTNDASSIAEFQRDKLMIETVENLSELCGIKFGFLEVEQEFMPCGRAMIDGFGLHEKVADEVKRIQNMVKNLPEERQREGEEQLWRLRLLLCKDGMAAFLAYNHKRYSEALSKIPDWLQSASVEKPELPRIVGFDRNFCAHAKFEARQLILDFKRLQAYVYRDLCLDMMQSLQSQSGKRVGQFSFSFNDLARYLEPCIKLGKEADIEIETVEPVANELHQLAENTLSDYADLKAKYAMVMILVDFTNFVKRHNCPIMRPAMVNFVVEYGLGVSDLIFDRALRALKSSQPKDQEMMKNNFQLHERLLRSLSLVDPYDGRILYFLGEVASMHILLLDPKSDDISMIVNSVYFRIDELQKQATELRDMESQRGLNELRSLVDQIRTRRSFHRLSELHKRYGHG